MGRNGFKKGESYARGVQSSNSEKVQKLIGGMAPLRRFISNSAQKCLPLFKCKRSMKDFQWIYEIEEAFKKLN